ncbi:MAG: hypothetical protein HC905_03530 [Bacteroidales bacterium]|nr:hypothetical protein [Bacteroidales bacterium]
MGEITPEVIVQADASLKQNRLEIVRDTQCLVLKQKEEESARKLKELIGQAVAFEKQLQELKKQEASINELEVKLSEFEYCRMHFQGHLEAFNAGEKRVNSLQQYITNDEKTLQVLKSRLKESEIVFEQLRIDYEQREGLKLQAEELAKVSRILELQKLNNQLKERVSNGEKFLTETKNKIFDLKLELEKSLDEIRINKSQIPDMKRLSEAKDWFTINELIGKSELEIAQELKVLAEEMEKLDQQKAMLFNSDCFTGIAVTETFENVITALEVKKRLHLTAIEILRMENQHFQVQLKLGEYASELKDGEPCPLCGSLAHPVKYNASDLAGMLSKSNNELKIHENAIEAINNGSKKLSELNTILCFKREAQVRILAKQKENNEKLSIHKQLFIWAGFQTKESVESEFTKAQHLQKLVSEKEETLEKMRTQLEKETQASEKYLKVVDELKRNMLEYATEAATVQNQLKIIDLSLYQNSNVEY